MLDNQGVIRHEFLIIKRYPVSDVAVGLGMDYDWAITWMRAIPGIVPATAHIKVESLSDSCGEKVIDEIAEGDGISGIGHAEFSVNAAQGSEEIAILVLTGVFDFEAVVDKHFLTESHTSARRSGIDGRIEHRRIAFAVDEFPVTIVVHESAVVPLGSCTFIEDSSGGVAALNILVRELVHKIVRERRLTEHYDTVVIRRRHSSADKVDGREVRVIDLQSGIRCVNRDSRDLLFTGLRAVARNRNKHQRQNQMKRLFHNPNNFWESVQRSAHIYKLPNKGHSV